MSRHWDCPEKVEHPQHGVDGGFVITVDVDRSVDMAERLQQGVSLGAVASVPFSRDSPSSVEGMSWGEKERPGGGG